MKREIVGACGIYCGGCKHYDEGKEVCGGCGSDKLTEFCSKSGIRICAKESGFLSCNECDEFPCERYLEFYSGGEKWEGARHRNDIVRNLKLLAEAGVDRWIKYQSSRWACDCGEKYTFYDEECKKCGRTVFSYKNIEYTDNKEFEKKFVINGINYIFRGLRENDCDKLGEYFEELSQETRRRFGPHPLDKVFASELCDRVSFDYYTARFVIEDIEKNRIEGYFILDFNLSPHEYSRYAEFGSTSEEQGIKLRPFKDVLFAPSIADSLQNKGLASEVMPFVIEFAKSKKAASLVLLGGTQETNTRAIRFYEKFGFRKTGGYLTEIYNHDMILKFIDEKNIERIELNEK